MGLGLSEMSARSQWGRSSGGHAGGWGSTWTSQGAGSNAAHNPFEVKLPKFISWLECNEDDYVDNSIIMIDDRDHRMVSPFQSWLAREIMSNSASSINVLTERDQVMPPSSGFHLSLFGNYTLDGIKVVVVVSLDTETGAVNAGWDADTARALSHPAFQPFSWPMLRDTSASYTDVKIYNGNEVLFHWIFRGFRADTDLTVQQQFVDEVLVREANRGKPRLSVVVACFVGWRVTVFSFECGGRTYSVGPRGAVVAGDHARSRFELRVCNRSSPDAMGNDADRVEFRFCDANNRLDLKCQRTSVPGTWLTVSHISGPTLIQTIQNVRQAGARVEGPEHTEQFGQLAAYTNTGSMRQWRRARRMWEASSISSVTWIQVISTSRAPPNCSWFIQRSSTPTRSRRCSTVGRRGSLQLGRLRSRGMHGSMQLERRLVVQPVLKSHCKVFR